MKRILTLLAAGLCTLGAQAQNEVMFIDADARNLGMGGVAMTGLSGSHSIYTNPAAGIFSRQKMQLAFSYLSPYEGNFYSLTGLYNFDSKNLLQAGWRKFTDTYGHPSDLSFDAGYTRRLGEKWSIGGVLHYYRTERWRSKASDALSIDLSFMYVTQLNFGSYSTLLLGGKVGNLGGYLNKNYSWHLPITATVGAAIDSFVSDAHEVTLGMDIGGIFEHGSQADWQLSAGAEYNLMQLFQLRAGYHYSMHEDTIPSYASVGAGVRFLHIHLDFAYLFAQKYSPFYKTWSISFGMDF